MLLTSGLSYFRASQQNLTCLSNKMLGWWVLQFCLCKYVPNSSSSLELTSPETHEVSYCMSNWFKFKVNSVYPLQSASFLQLMLPKHDNFKTQFKNGGSDCKINTAAHFTCPSLWNTFTNLPHTFHLTVLPDLLKSRYANFRWKRVSFRKLNIRGK